MKTIKLAFVFDDKFSDLFTVAAYSASKNTKSDLAIYIVDCGISEQNREKILKLQERCGNIKSMKIGTPRRVDAIEKLQIPSHFSSAIFYRLAIPEIFPDLDRVIYLDCDVVVDGDIANLWNEDLNGKPFGAIEEDGNFFKSKTRRRYKEKLGIPVGNSYYSTGTLLIDCKKFKKSCIFARVIECVKTTKATLLCPEQDAMNICLKKDEHVAISPTYGFPPCAPLAKQCLKKIKEPIVLHYSCFKPWDMSKPVVRIFDAMGLFRCQTSNFLKFWEYAAEVDFFPNPKKRTYRTLRFFFKRVFQPIERFVAKGIRDNILVFFSKRPSGRSQRRERKL
ncbi:MAG: glycosyltransferase family 8 protein [Puniceicoccales bacterium]|jgi:lipopolysaccharide biosynthesis glycosyltransferase|nr:glycosyltransferase family 8 protein [Puniceicoccales bacterium]